MVAKTDVLVIGGGAVGLCTAYYLAQADRSVTLVEKGKIGSGCSDKNAGLIVPSHIIPLAAPGVIKKGLRWLFNPNSPFYIKPRFSLELASWVWQFMRASREQRMRESIPVLHHLLQASYPLFMDFTGSQESGAVKMIEDGLLMIYRTAKALEADVRDAERARQLGLEVSILDQQGLTQTETGLAVSAVGGIFYHQDAHLDPQDFIASLTSKVSENAVQVKAETEVTGFDLHQGKIRTVKTTGGDFSANQVVLAGGSWSPEIVAALGVKLPIQAGKGYSVTVSRPNVKPRLPAILAEAKIAVTPFADSLRFSGTLEIAGLDLSVSTRRVQGMLNAVQSYYPEMDMQEALHAPVWSGLRPCTPDGLPIIGRAEDIDNLLIAAGHAMLGISLAPVTGKIVAEMIEGKAPSVDVTALSPTRFN